MARRKKKKAHQAEPAGADLPPPKRSSGFAQAGAPPEEEAATDLPPPKRSSGFAQAGAAADQAAGQAAEDDPVARLEAEAASLKDQLLRALAETENLRRRSQREREDAVRYAAAPLIKDLIEVTDNLRRALESVPEGAAEGDEQLKNLLAGVELTEKDLLAVFERHNIVKIDPLGERLDPYFHEAIFEIPDQEKPAGTVLQVVRAGYRLFDRLLRPAQVGVARGGPQPEPAPNEAAEAPGPDPTTTPAETDVNGPGSEGGPGTEDDDVPPGSRVDTQA